MKNMNGKMRFAVIGDPIEHSLSPCIHFPVFKRLVKEGEYFKEEVKKGELGKWMKRVAADRISGFNVTMPHKTDIIAYLDELRGDARVFHSVNTVINCRGRLVGHNTDGDGFLLSLKRAGYRLKNSNLLILGAGGAARTLAIKAALEGAESVAILARTQDRAKEVADEIKSYGIKVHFGGLDEISFRARGSNLIINATPLGMAGTDEDFNDFSFLDRPAKGSLIFDLIYRPIRTRLLTEAKAKGLNIQNGLGMLIYQGLLADKLFLEAEFDLDVMYQEIELTLEGKVDR